MSFREFIDWHPFAYFTSSTRMTAAHVPRSVIETVEFVPLGGDGTRIIVRYRATNRSHISLLAARATHPLMATFWRRRGGDLIRIAKEDATTLELGGRSDPQHAKSERLTT
jgi:hypothetical protein